MISFMRRSPIEALVNFPNGYHVYRATRGVPRHFIFDLQRHLSGPRDASLVERREHRQFGKSTAGEAFGVRHYGGKFRAGGLFGIACLFRVTEFLCMDDGRRHRTHPFCNHPSLDLYEASKKLTYFDGGGPNAFLAELRNLVAEK